MMSIALILTGFMFFAVGRKLAAVLINRSGRVQTVAIFCCMILALPAILYAMYYAHVLDRAAWFFTLRAERGSELLAAPAGLLFGMLPVLLRRMLVLQASAIVKHALSPLAAISFAAILVVPYLKPYIVPLTTPYADHWRDGVCIQTTPSTCGPSSAATLLQQFGISASERELGIECNTCGSGTENWYIARALRRRGLTAKYVLTSAQPTVIPLPSICGTQLGKGGAGHFIAILSQQGSQYVIGDPISGRQTLSIDEIKRRFYLTGFFLVVGRDSP